MFYRVASQRDRLIVFHNTYKKKLISYYNIHNMLLEFVVIGIIVCVTYKIIQNEKNRYNQMTKSQFS